MVNCIFLYYPRSPYIEEALANLGRFDLNIRKIPASPEIVSNLVPNALKLGAESWLIFFLPDKQQELLILPFPDENQGQRPGNPEIFWLPLADLIPTVHRYLALTGEDRYIPLDWIGRFQYICPNVPLDSLLNEGYTRQNRSLAQRIQNVLQGTSRIIQQQRSEILRRAISSRNPSLLTELDDALVRENRALFHELLYQSRFLEVVPPIVEDFKDIIDPETKRFLITSETVRKFAYKYSPANFDYSAPGCGLWKAVERELNLSLVLHLRREKNIVNDVQDPLTSNIDPYEEFLINTKRGVANVNINLREPESPNNLKGIQLGPMQTMLQWGYNNGIHSKLERLFPTDTTMRQYFLGSCASRDDLEVGTLPWHLEELRKLRNGHAHISAMSPEQFEKLHELVLPSNDNSETCLVKILQLKKKVLEHGLKRKFLELVYSQIS